MSEFRRASFNKPWTEIISQKHLCPSPSLLLVCSLSSRQFHFSVSLLFPVTEFQWRSSWFILTGLSDFELWGARPRFFLPESSGVSANDMFGHIPNSILSSRKKLPLCFIFTWLRGYCQEAPKSVSLTLPVEKLVSF